MPYNNTLEFASLDAQKLKVSVMCDRHGSKNEIDGLRVEGYIEGELSVRAIYYLPAIGMDSKSAIKIANDFTEFRALIVIGT